MEMNITTTLMNVSTTPVLIHEWTRLGFGNSFFHLCQARHEAMVLNRTLFVTTNNSVLDDPWQIADLFNLEQDRYYNLEDARLNYPDNVYHSMGFWDVPFAYENPSESDTLFHHWQKVVTDLLQPSWSIINDLREHLGMKRRKFSSERRRRPLLLSFAPLMQQLFPDSKHWKRPWISVHVRAADSLADVSRPPLHVRSLKELLAVLPPHVKSGTILLASDSEVDFGNSSNFKIVSIPMNRKKYSASNVLIEFRKDVDQKTILLETLADIGFLSRGDILVMPMYGNMARTIASLSKKGAIIISSDGSSFCPFHACDMGRVDDKYRSNGGAASVYIRNQYGHMNLTKDNCNDRDYIVQQMHVPREVAPFWQASCLFAVGAPPTREQCESLHNESVNPFSTTLKQHEHHKPPQ